MIAIDNFDNIVNENDVTVLKGDRDYYFLHQKNTGQNQFDYYVGNKEICSSRVSNFNLNIENNLNLCTKRNIPYIHLICQSKEVAHRDLFLKYSGLELNSLVSHEFLYHQDVIYPKLSIEDFYVGDSHNNNRGAYKQIQQIMPRLLPDNDENFHPEFKLKSVSNGDLVSKLKQQMFVTEEFIEGLFGIDNDTAGFNLSQFMNGNSGNIQYSYNQYAINDKRLLIFGDSFVGGHINVYSLFFEEIVFLRSPFIIEHIVDIIEPDLILTENTERYLVNVPHFRERPWFLNYFSHSKFNKDLGSKEVIFLEALFGGRENKRLEAWKSKNKTNIDKNKDSYSPQEIVNQKDLDFLVMKAISLESSNLEKALELMSVAKIVNPSGKFIKNKIELYTSQMNHIANT